VTAKVILVSPAVIYCHAFPHFPTHKQICLPYQANLPALLSKFARRHGEICPTTLGKSPHAAGQKCPTSRAELGKATVTFPDFYRHFFTL